jgi:Uma2 family endonuclease
MALQHPQTKPYTIEEFDQFIALPENADRRFELIDGEIIEKMPTEERGVIVSTLSGEIYVFLKQNPLGRLK